MKINAFWERFNELLEKVSIPNTSATNVALKSIYFLILLILIPLLLSTDNTVHYTDLKIGSIATKKVVAPYNFFILKTNDELKKDRDEAIKEVPYFFKYDSQATRQSLNDINNAFNEIRTSLRDIKIKDDTLTAEKSRHVEQIRNHFSDKYHIELSTGNFIALHKVFENKEQSNRFAGIITWIRHSINRGIINIDPATIKRTQVAWFINDVEEKSDKNNVYSTEKLLMEIADKARPVLSQMQTSSIQRFLKPLIEPNLTFDDKMTQKEIDKAVAGVSLTKDMVYENERIVDANERIDKDIYQKLYSLEAARIERSEKEGNWQAVFSQVGRIMLLACILFVIGLYLFSFRKRVFADNKQLLLITAIILMQVMISALIAGPLNWPMYLIPTTIASMMLAILIDSGIAFVTTVAIGLIVGGIQGGGYDITLMTIVSGMVSIFSVHEIRTRNHIFKAIFFIALAYFWIIAGTTLLRFDSLNSLAKIFVYNLLPNAVFAPFFTYMILGAFEKAFDITTDVRLLELSDLNHPLLKELSIKAPGTFHHSMIVGNLSEAAAKEIGENSLLTRVGSYYHDIGKIEKPEYFVENQMDANNRHSKLKPTMSALILASHVKTGIEMAREFNVPRRIRDFIAEHHGTSLMYFFYNKAIARAGDKDNVNESDFRYPGPKPRSKATAIVMLADTVEAATRTLKDPTPTKIRTFVDGLVEQKFKDGELNECDLTFKELKQIVDAFMPVLYGVFQRRIDYPERDEKTKTRTKNQPDEKAVENEYRNSSK